MQNTLTSPPAGAGDSFSGPVLVSACLLGVRCRYDGTSRENPAILALLSSECVVPICPELLGGLPTARAPCGIEGGTGADVLEGRALVVDGDGVDRTESFLRGATEAARLARVFGARRAVLKKDSPSCDVGLGVAAARLRAEGLLLEGAD